MFVENVSDFIVNEYIYIIVKIRIFWLAFFVLSMVGVSGRSRRTVQGRLILH